MRFTRTLLAAAAIAAASGASAATTDVSLVSSAPLPQVFSEFSFFGGAFSQYAVQEYIVTSTSPDGTFAAFCLDPFKFFFATNPSTFEVKSFSPAIANELSKVFTGAGWKSWDPNNDAVDQNSERVALGAAVWDIMIDGKFDLANGNFRMSGNDGFGGAALAFANASYAAGDTSMASSLLYLDYITKDNGIDRQDLVIAVPEPSTYALMFAGLAAVGFVARRRRQA